MSRALDITKAEAALKRAAHKAIHGTREERSGRYLPEKDRLTGDGYPSKGSDVAKRKAGSRAARRAQ